MTDTATAGRRRATTDGLDAAIVRDFPDAGQPPRPVEDAFQFTSDRLDRLEHTLGSLQATTQRLGMRLEPVLTDGGPARADRPLDAEVADPTPEDRRSTIARRISGHGMRADRLADLVTVIERSIEDLTDALEV